jgi:hypothetical protein
MGETSRHLEVRIKEHKYNLIQGLVRKPKLAQHAYKEGHKICWKEAKVLYIEPDTTYRKHKESTHVSLVGHKMNQHILNISPIWTSIIEAESSKLNYA